MKYILNFLGRFYGYSNRISIYDIEILKHQNIETLIDWYNKINSDEGKIKELGRIRGKRGWDLMLLIPQMIGQMEISRKHNSAMPDDEFREFWENEMDFIHSYGFFTFREPMNHDWYLYNKILHKK